MWNARYGGVERQGDAGEEQVAGCERSETERVGIGEGAALVGIREVKDGRVVCSSHRGLGLGVYWALAISAF